MSFDRKVDVAENASVDPISITAKIVIAYVAYNSLPASGLPELIDAIYVNIVNRLSNSVPSRRRSLQLTSAQIQESITRDALISFEDGRSYKTLKRHLTSVGLTPDAYRAKWGLPSDYPMVATSYSERRAAVARGIGLGQRYGAVPEKPLVRRRDC